MTVKVRIGTSDKDINLHQVVDALADTGVAAVTVHGRTMTQRYKKAANWDLIWEAAQRCRGRLPLVGNGDILAVYEFAHRMSLGDCHAAMVGRGALIKPWIFQEVANGGQELLLTAEERVSMYHTLSVYMKDHFGQDERGKRKAWYFYPWHFEWFARYRPFPAAALGAQSEAQPLITTRWDVAVPEAGEDPATLPALERLLRCAATPCHERLAEECW